MPSRPIEAHSSRDHLQKLTHTNNNLTRQHGHPIPRLARGTPDVLVGIPPESLTHVTSFLDPPDLLILAQTCKRLNTHVTDDNTWRRAYAYQYLGITPESDLSDDAAFMLRKTEISWRKEFIVRYKLRRRWESSRTTTITHIPLHSTVTAMHLMPQTTVLAASLQYGVVSRSYPLTGKVLRGFLDASGTMNGLGMGNPNAEFSPHVSSIALASEGGAAKILWGFRNGEVAVTVAPRAMDDNRTTASRLVRCRPIDCHENAVECVAWASNSDDRYVFFVSGGADGQVRLWEATTSLKCLWSSDTGTSLVADPCVKVVIDLQLGVIAAASRSGAILVWAGFPSLYVGSSNVATSDLRVLRIPVPIVSAIAPGSSPHDVIPQVVTELRIAPRGQELSLLVAYHPNAHIFRYSLKNESNEFERTLFGDLTSDTITTVFPVWASRLDEENFVIVGDEHGSITIFHWDSPFRTSQATPGTGPKPPTHRLAAHEDGAITAFGWNSVVLVSGSARGSVKVWDALTFALLRTFPSPTPRSVEGECVGQILLERDTLVVSVGNRVLAWKAGPVGGSAGHGKGKSVRTASGRVRNGVAKWQRQIEIYRDIAESRHELEQEQMRSRRVYGREKEQLSTLAHLGLNEVEAVEYVLMISRDEEEARRRRTEELPFRDDEGVFMVDFDDPSTPMVTPASISEPPSAVSSRTSSSSAAPSSPKSGNHLSDPQSTQGRSLSASSSSHYKVPRVHPEPTEAGSSTSYSPSRGSSASAEAPVSLSDLDHFPAVAVSRTSSLASAASGSSARISVSSSPQSARGASAWNTPLRSLHSSEAPSPSHGGGDGSSISASPARSSSRGPTSAPHAAPLSHLDEDDEELRFAIELSLAEAMSRGEKV